MAAIKRRVRTRRSPGINRPGETVAQSEARLDASPHTHTAKLAAAKKIADAQKAKRKAERAKSDAAYKKKSAKLAKRKENAIRKEKAYAMSAKTLSGKRRNPIQTFKK